MQANPDDWATAAMDTLASYLPQDRRRALAAGTTLPDRVDGAALFADISDFTPLTQALTRALDPRRGAEALTRHVDAVYEVLITEVDRFGGSSLGFAGDAITCWFEGQQGDQGSLGSAPHRAASCALAMQMAAKQFAAIPLPDGASTTLTLKVAVTSGASRRFVVGDPDVQLLDVLAGAVIDRLTVCENLIHSGEVLVDARTAAAIAGMAQLGEWREDQDTGERFVLLESLSESPEPYPHIPAAPEPTAEQLRPWLPREVYEHELSGQGAFLTELRPAVALFLRFRGIDFEDDQAGPQLDRFIRRVQSVLGRHDATFLGLTIGDKGSYFSAAFGAPIAHEDDDRRAVDVALALREVAKEQGCLTPVQIGISRGPVRSGAYGGATRRTYGVMGDDVNLAARLMGLAAPGEILISGRVQGSIHADFGTEPRPPLMIKGIAEPVSVFAVTGEHQRWPIRLQEPTYVLPMVGRTAEMGLIGAKMDLTLQGKGQIVGITADAGMGKSRLVAEAIRVARRRNFTGYGGACRSDGISSSYLVWSDIWRAFFDLDPEMSLRKQLRWLEGEIEELAPERSEALPLLGDVIGLPIPDTDFSRALEPKDRKSALEALLVDCLRTAAQQAAQEGGGLLLVLEDLQWIDALSHDLLEQVARATASLPVLILLAYRPPDLPRLQAPRLQALPHFTEIALPELSAAEAEQAIRAKLSQLFPEKGGAVPAVLIDGVTARAQGNPFYVEELLNYLHDRGLDPRDPADLARIELPDSLHRLILSRIDQLTARQQLVIKVASIIGRVFQFLHLLGYYPSLGQPHLLKADLDELKRLDLTPLDAPEPDLAYLFKHIVTREVAYTSLSHETRVALHEQFARYLEVAFFERPPLDLLAHHYGCSDNLTKKREYLRRAGDAARAAYANEAAIDYYSEALAATPVNDVADRYALLLERYRLYDLLGARQLQSQDMEVLFDLAEHLDDDQRRIEVALLRGAFADTVGDYPTTITQAQRAIALAQKTGDLALEARGTNLWAKTLWRQAAYAESRHLLEKALDLALRAGAWEQEAASLFTLGAIADKQGNYAEAREHMEQTLQRFHDHNDRRGESLALNSLGVVAYNQRDHVAALRYLEQSLVLKREFGDRYAEGVTLNNLGLVALRLRDFTRAQQELVGCLRLCEHIQDREGESAALSSLGSLALRLGDLDKAQAYLERALVLAREIGDREGEAVILAIQGKLALTRGDLMAAESETRSALQLAQDIGDPATQEVALTNLGHVLFAQANFDESAEAFRHALGVRAGNIHSGRDTEPLAGLARVALKQGNLVQARAYAEETLALMETPEFDEVEEPFQAYLTCWQVLAATPPDAPATAPDPRAAELLDRAHRLLQESAAQLGDESARRLYLQVVPHHRELVKAWQTGHPSSIQSESSL